ncbi:MAG TPA: hypothetical protein VHC69_16430 [Polyangiaceae bacterium]|nr:hypothetical protein [Polyangiaceae bacterium]
MKYGFVCSPVVLALLALGCGGGSIGNANADAGNEKGRPSSGGKHAAAAGGGANESGGAEGGSTQGSSGGSGTDGGTMGSGGAGNPGSGGSSKGSGGASTQSSGGAGQSTGGTTPQGPAVAVTPQVARIQFGGAVQFTAIVTGVTDRTVNWTVTEGTAGGSVSSAGRYTAPSTSGTYHVVATSASNKSLSATATVTVTAVAGTPPTLTPGVWLDITPPAPGLADTFGSPSVDLSPVDPKVLYVSVDTLGIWRSRDAGTSWAIVGDSSKKPASGATTTSYIDSPIRVAVDPGDPNHLYVTQGVRGSTLGFWVSHDEGATWTMPPSYVTLAQTTTRDVTQFAVDPSNFKHVIIASHSPWANNTTAGLMETKDGGDSWNVIPAQPGWPTGSIAVNFLYDPVSGQGDPNTWLVGTDGVGMYRTTDGGSTWTKVSTENVPHGGGAIYYASNGWVWAGAAKAPIYSKDNGKNWAEATGLPYFYYYTVIGDGKTLYTQLSYTGTNAGQGLQPYWSAPEGAGGPWAKYQNGAQTFNDGPFTMRFDSANRIIYSANWKTGVWALKVLD